MDSTGTRLDLLTRLAELARECPERQAAVSVECDTADDGLTYGHLAQATLHLAGRLRRELPAGGVVIVCGANAPELFPAVLGVLAAGMTVFPTHPGVSEPELRRAVAGSRAVAVIGDGRTLRVLADVGLLRIDLGSATDVPAGVSAPSWSDFDQMHSGLLLQSSGTTGRPKIVRRLAPALDAVAHAVVAAVGLRPDDRVLAAIPLCHAYGLESAMLGPLVAGSCVLTCDGFPPAVISRAFAEGGVTVFPGVPFMFQVLAELDIRRVSALRRTYSAGGPLPAGIAEAFTRRTGVRIGQLYGASEIGSATFNDPDEDGFLQSSVGRPMRGVEIRVVQGDDPARPVPVGDEGQVAVRAASMLNEYADDDTPALTNGFFLTGDLGRLDDRGRLSITGRVKLQIDVGGLKVNPLEVEFVLCQFPGVRECAVVPMRVAETVNRLRALVVPDRGQSGFNVAALRRFARSRLAAYKVPRLIEICDSLPRSPTGKIQRHALAET